MRKLMVGLFIALCLGVGSAEAQRSSLNGQQRAALQKAQKVQRSLGELVRALRRVPATELPAVLAELSRSTDSDADGLSDIVELGLGSRVCDDDSDDDGISDGNEGLIGTNPRRPEREDRRFPNEVEREGLLAEISSTAAVVEGVTFAITPQTRLIDEEGNELALEDFTVGACVEAEGFRIRNSVRAKKLKLKADEDSCGESDDD